ncbi:MAG: HAMP domain-containing histidine kinase [Ktedonobacteraceae bacterium]|nr:HAMP domain-containing histidine kinase [Ktedonobacteraceae bacterium]
MKQQTQASVSKKRSRLLIDIPIGWRLAIGFLLAALIASAAVGITGSQQAQTLNVESDFYQSLLQENILLSTADSYLQLLNSTEHELLGELVSPHPSQETIQTDRNALQGLMSRYNTILSSYTQQQLLDQHPDQVALLSKAGYPVQVTLQRTLAASALRTWHIFQEAQQTVRQKIAAGLFAEAVTLERLQVEPTNSDALSALRALIHFNEELVVTMRAAVHATGQGLLVTIPLTALLAFLCVGLVGIFISRPLVRRLLQLLLVTEAATQGQAHTRISVIGHDEIAVVSTSVNTMLDTLAEDKAIATAYEQERRLSQLKDQFILNVTHELRTPLTEIYGYLELLSAYPEQLDTLTRASFISYAMNGCNDLMALISTIMDAKEINAEIAPPHLESCSLSRLINELLNGWNPQEMEAHPIHRAVPESLLVWADQYYVRRVLRNLLSNAFKYTPAGTPIVIEATLSEENKAGLRQHTPGQVSISVQDAGPGIPPGELPLLFQKFVRLKRDLSGSVRGTGLGLYISKQLVEAMGGQMWAESSGVQGEGSRFCFTLPEALAENEVEQNRRATASGAIS